MPKKGTIIAIKLESLFDSLTPVPALLSFVFIKQGNKNSNFNVQGVTDNGEIWKE